MARTTAQYARHLDDLAFARNPFRSLANRFVIATSPRTGSHLLMEGLLGRGALVDEHFNFDRVRAERAARGVVTLRRYCDALIAERAVGGVFGVKGPPHVITPCVLAGEFPRFLADWRFVHLTRENAVREAISWEIAVLSGAWRSFEPARREVVDDDYNVEAIAARIARKRAINAEWEAIFAHFGIAPLRITYEQLAADTAATVAGTADFLGLHGAPITDARLVPPALTSQSTELNARWEARFRAQSGLPPAPGPASDLRGR